MPEFQVGTFKKYIALHTVQLGFTHDGSSQPNLVENEPFEFDGQTLRMGDGRSWGSAFGLRGMLEAGYIVPWEAPKVKQKKVKVAKAAEKVSVEKPATGAYSGMLEDFESSIPAEVKASGQSEEYRAFLAWKASQDEDSEVEMGSDEEDEDDMTLTAGEEDEDDEEEDIVVMAPPRRGPRLSRTDDVVELRGGIGLDRRQNDVVSGRDFGTKKASTMEGSARAQVGSLAHPLSSGAQVGRQEASDYPGRKGREVIGFEGGSTSRTVSIITSAAKTTSDMSGDHRDPRDVIKGPKHGLPVQHVGEGAAAAKRAEAARARELKDEKRLITEHNKKIAAIQKRHPKFEWDLGVAADSRFDQAFAYWQKGQTNKTSKKVFELILEVELPDMVTRLQQEIDYNLQGPRR